MKFSITFLLGLIALSFAQAQSYWADVSEQRVYLPTAAEVDIRASEYRTLSLDFSALKQALQAAPAEYTAAAQASQVAVYLPMPEGQLEAFEVVETHNMHPNLAARYPQIRTYAGRSLERPHVSARFEVTPLGFTAGIFTPNGRVYVEPYATQQTRYHIAYYKKHLQIENLPERSCGYDDFVAEELNEEAQRMNDEQLEIMFRSAPTVPLRTYRLALSCTGEFAQGKGGTLEGVLSAYNQALNRINEIFQTEVAVRMQLIENNDELINLDPGTDPFNNANTGTALLGQNQEYLNSVIGLNSYDIGHIFTGPCTDVGGVVSGTVCTPGKGRGVTCHYSSNPVFIAEEVMSHEIAHQFSVGHSWANCPGILEQLSSSNAYEPGSGSTIMSYAGACGNQNIVFNSNEYYNIGSLEDYIFYARQGTGSTCGTEAPTMNHEPEIQMPYEDGFFIPIETPFVLEATATDEDGDNLTYIWEQFDLGPVTPIGQPTGNAPLFRSFPPSPNGNKRTFPALNKIISNTFDATEVLPSYARDLTFQFVVRDNNPENGASVWQPVAFKSDATAGPFQVLTANENGTVWAGGSHREVNWDVANTTNPRVNCQYVDILLSVDGGFTYPYTLLAGTPNDGSAMVDVPNVATDDARIRVQASGNIFFDINDIDFVIEEAAEPGYAMSVTPVALPLVCLPSDPLSIEISTTAFLGFDSTLQLSLIGGLPEGSTATFASDTLTAGNSTTLTLDIQPNEGRDTLDFFVQAIVPGVDTSLRELRVITLSSDFSELALLEPADGTGGIVFSTDFSWNAVPSAETYDIEIATSPSFAPETILETSSGLAVAEYSPDELFEPSTLYFWRVRPQNDCGPGEFLPPFAFRTNTVDCINNEPADLPVNLSNNPSVRESKIFVTQEGTISDINIDNVEISYSPISVLQVSIISPEGTEVLLFDQSCLNTGLMRASFDDEAPNPISCPPINTLPVRPEEELSAFIGENTFGEWTLRVRVVNPGFGGGSLKEWGLEFCAAVTATAPVMITNEVIGVPPGQGNTITTDFLEVQDDVSAPEDLKYILISTPANGQLFRNGVALGVGDFFTQQTINAFNLTYVHDGSDTDADGFTFLVEDEEGGWIPTQTFSIEIDENATVSTADLSLEQTIRVFPNPARDEVQVSFGQLLQGRATLELRSLQGALLMQKEADGLTGAHTLRVSSLPKGIYLLQVRTAAGTVTRRLAVQ